MTSTLQPLERLDGGLGLRLSDPTRRPKARLALDSVQRQNSPRFALSS